MRWVWGVLALLWIPQPASPQASRAYTVDRWNVDQGLPNNDITTLVQSRDGYLWVGTWAGAVRFDGVRFTPIAADVPNDHMRVLYEDRDGAMWIGVSGFGLVKWRPSGFESYSPANGLPGRDVRTIAQDGAGRVWVGTESGLAVIADGRVTGRGLTTRARWPPSHRLEHACVHG
jgi:ligand-binding sensor domain-containing protein